MWSYFIQYNRLILIYVQVMEVDCKLEDPRPPLEEGCVQLGDVKDMRLEAKAVVSDVLFAVTHMCVSQALSSSLDVAYINTETREGDRYCLELSEAGLRVRRGVA